MTVGFVDNDILLKLTAFGLFDDAIATLNLSPSDLRILPTARFVFRQKRAQQVSYTDEVWARAINRVERYQTIGTTDARALAELQKLDAFRDQIHVGETALIAATCTAADFVLMSGDKGCLRALPQIPSEIYGRLQGRIVCLEQLVLKLIEVLGFEAVRERIQPLADCDVTMRICFGYSEPALEA
ncbi:MAG: hypothetical protein AAF152_20390, partial [Cyanobacteria bacterium P01_A01_bin.114]